jgi:DNA-binding GntR family transcriptional regulator
MLRPEMPIEEPSRAGRRELSLTDRAYAILRMEIITCQMRPGSEVSELELAERLGMSKTPVREALGRLNLEGFVETYPRRGYRITPVTIKDINDLFAVRGVLESRAAALAAQNMSDQDFDRLDQLADASYSLEEEKSLDHFVDANLVFHSMIAEGSKNPKLYNIIMALLHESQRFFYIGARTRDVNVETNRDHSGIVDVLRNRDAAAASQIMAAHVEETRVGINQSILLSASAAVGL